MWLQPKNWPPVRNRARSFQKPKDHPNKIKISLLYFSLENNYGTSWLRFMIPALALIFPAFSSSKGFLWIYVEQKNWEGTQKLCRNGLEKSSEALRKERTWI